MSTGSVGPSNNGVRPAPRPLSPQSQGLVDIMMRNLAANNANPEAVDQYAAQRDADRASPSPPPAYAGVVGMGPYGHR